MALARRRTLVIAVLLVLLLPTAGCVLFRCRVRNLDTPFGKIGEAEIVFNSLTPAQRDDTKEKVCRLCTAYKSIRDLYRSQASLPAPVGPYSANLADLYGRLFAECERYKAIIGPCPGD